MEKRVKYSCLQSLKEAGAPIVIVSVAREAEAIANACRDMGIVVSAFCDNEERMTVNHFCGLEVIHTPKLPLLFPKARFIIACQHIVDVTEQLTQLGYDEFYSALELLENYDASKHQHLISQSYMESRISVYKKTHEAYFDEEKTYMRSVDVMITTKCSLKCESCSNLMQYYVNPQNTDSEKTLEALEVLHKNADEISEFRIMGGEPLMNKDWVHIVKAIIDKNAERKIFIYTNATIVPNDNQLEFFHGKDVIFIITEYGKLSRNKDKLTEKLDQHGITYVSTPAQNWQDCSRIQHHKRTGPELEEVFKQCCAKYLYTLLDEKLYRCPFIANASNLKAMPDNPANYVDLFSKTQNIKQQLHRLVKADKFFPACDYCDGRPADRSSTLGYDGKRMIAAGRQTPKPLPYALY